MAGLPPERISRFLTYLLRHQPKDYPLVFDARGFVDWRDIVELVQERFYDVTEEQIEAVEPPERLYYGTARDLAHATLKNGLKPRDRQYVHLSVTAEEAESVARRHDPTPAIIVIDARAAQGEGVLFYQAGPLFVVENVPAKFLSLQ